MEGYIGQIILFAGNFAPEGWHFCDGALLPINQNQALYSIIGTKFGGDGITTFNLPHFEYTLEQQQSWKSAQQNMNYIICIDGLYPPRP